MTGRLLIANRGEIARRVLRAGRERGLAVAVISTPEDADACIRKEADAVLEVSSFLAGAEIVAAAVAWGATLVHPGYGFLSENAEFAEAVEAAGIAFLGPRPETMRALGAKEAAKRLAQQCGVPTLPALLSHELAAVPSSAWGPELEARGLKAPFLVKASGGGGGRGMRVVPDLAGLPEAIKQASSEALAGFGDGTVFVERYLAAPRHIEVQVFGDGEGGGVFLGERECSLQRRHQKVIEEAPSAVVDVALREALGRAAMALVRETRYRGAGTVEFLMDAEGQFHFLEVNTRLQVEHPVTEAVYGVDLVQAQLELAEGRWPKALGDPGTFRVPEPQGVSLEARILAEDPRHGFLPTPGNLSRYREPGGQGVRVDSGVIEGGRVNDRFDSMIAKLIVWGPDRREAVDRLAQALSEFVILGCVTNLPFLLALSRHPDFLHGRVSTDWIAANLPALNGPLLPEGLARLVEGEAFRSQLSETLQGLGAPISPVAARFAAQAHPELKVGSRDEKPFLRIEHAGSPARFTLRWDGPEVSFHALRRGHHLDLRIQGESLLVEDPLSQPAVKKGASSAGVLCAPMAGKILECRVAVDDIVEEGQVLFILESMKMQMEVCTSAAGRVAALFATAGQVMEGPDPLAEVVAVTA
jgi:acetyl/propionyl-CoA carboxylase alpha subunit